MSGRTLNWVLWPIAGAVIGFLASVAFCAVKGFENYQHAKAEVLIFGHVIHEESGPPNSGLSDHVVATWGSGLNAGFAVLGTIVGIVIAALVNRVSRTTGSVTMSSPEPR